MSVVLRYWAAARAAAGVDQDVFEASTLADLLEQASARHAALGRVLSMCSFLVDEVQVGRRPHDQVRLHDGSVVEALPPFAGG